MLTRKADKLQRIIRRSCQCLLADHRFARGDDLAAQRGMRGRSRQDVNDLHLWIIQNRLKRSGECCPRFGEHRPRCGFRQIVNPFHADAHRLQGSEMKSTNGAAPDDRRGKFHSHTPSRGAGTAKDRWSRAPARSATQGSLRIKNNRTDRPATAWQAHSGIRLCRGGMNVLDAAVQEPGRARSAIAIQATGIDFHAAAFRQFP